MEPKLRDYVEKLFASAPKTHQAYELKEEIIRNTIERYHDLISEGRSEGEAYNLAISGIGDINELIEALGGEVSEKSVYTDDQLACVKSRQSVFNAIAVALYILCFTPCILLEATPLATASAAIMFFMISIATGLIIYGARTKYIICETDKDKITAIKKKALLRAVAVGMYISCVTPCILLAETALVEVSPVFMFLMIALATVIIVLSKDRTSYTKADDTMVENFKEWNGKKKETSALYKILVAILWITTSILYVYITVATGLVTVVVTWVIFLVAVAVQNLIKAIFDYVEARK